MSAFRGARLLASLGHHGLKCNRLHQRRIISLGLTSLCQVTMKKQALLDINALPVNKFDLSSIGILSPTLSILFSTEASSLSEGESSELTEEESSEAGRIIQVNKSPLLKDETVERSQQENCMVFIGGFNFDHNEEYIRQLFSQFGEVEDVKVPNKMSYDATPCRPEWYRYAFLTFTNHSSFRRAVEAVSITTPNNTTVDIQDGSDSVRISENERTFLVNALTDDITVQQLHDYFKTFAQVELVNLVFKTQTSTEGTTRKNIHAYVLFKSGSDLQSLYYVTHYIGSKRIFVIPVKEWNKRQPRDRCKVILLSGLDESVSEEQLRMHFDQIGLVRNVSLFKNDSGVGNGRAIVRFVDKETALSAAELQWHEIGGTMVKGHLLGILNE